MKNLKSNAELYAFLQNLNLELKSLGANESAELASFAARHISSSSTEFLGESRISLRRILKQDDGLLAQQTKTDIASIIEQITRALEN